MNDMPVGNALRQLEAFGQSPWLDFIQRSFTAGGKLQDLIDRDGLKGVTGTTPTTCGYRCRKRMAVRGAEVAVRLNQSSHALSRGMVAEEPTPHADNAEAGWAAVEPTVETWGAGHAEVHPHDAVGAGPAAADALLERDGRRWLGVAP